MALGTRSLKKGELVTILGEIYRNRETGTLVLQRDDLSKFLYAQEGLLIFAASNAAEDKFTEILVQKGKLTSDQLAIATEKKEGRTIGRTLVEMGFLASNDLLDALIDQMRKIAASTANWAAGRAVFKAGILPQNLARLPVSTPRFIIDTALAVEDREWAAAALGQLEEPLTISQAEKDVLAGLTLSAQESQLVERVDGRRNTREICESAGVDLFTGARFLIGLSQLGLVHLKQMMAPTPPSRHARAKVGLDFLDEAAAEDPPLLPKEPEAGGAEAPEAPQGGAGGVPFEPPAAPTEQPPSAPDTRPLGKPEPAPAGPATKPAKGSLFPDLIFPEDDKEEEARETSGAPSDEDEEGRGRGFKRWIAVLGVTAVILACAGVAAWYFFLRETPYVPMEPVGPAHGRMAARGDRAAATASQMPADRPAVPKQAETPTAATSSAMTSPAGPSSSAAVAQPAAKPPVTTAPQPSAAASGDTEREARSLLRQGRYKEAALAFQGALQNSRARFAIDVEVACQAETIQKGFAASGGDPRYMILPYNLHGRPCFRVVWGFYKDRATAEQALKTMPDFFLQNASPRVATRPR
jgi:hypothetical protein